MGFLTYKNTHTPAPQRKGGGLCYRIIRKWQNSVIDFRGSKMFVESALLVVCPESTYYLKSYIIIKALDKTLYSTSNTTQCPFFLIEHLFLKLKWLDIKCRMAETVGISLSCLQRCWVTQTAQISSTLLFMRWAVATLVIGMHVYITITMCC